MSDNSLTKMIRLAVDKYGYINTSRLKKYLLNAHVSFSDPVLRQTVHRLMKRRNIYDAGQGWYSSLETEYSLHTAPVEEDVEVLEEEFPFLEFCVWSNQQIASHYHHLPTKFLIFIHTEKNTQEAVFNFLLSQEKHAYLDPKTTNMQNFHQKKYTYIVRSSIPRQPCSNHFATVEKILVDLHVENEKFNLMGEEEFRTILFNIAAPARIQVSRLLSYSHERNRRDIFEEYIQWLQHQLKNQGA